MSSLLFIYHLLLLLLFIIVIIVIINLWLCIHCYTCNIRNDYKWHQTHILTDYSYNNFNIQLWSAKNWNIYCDFHYWDILIGVTVTHMIDLIWQLLIIYSYWHKFTVVFFLWKVLPNDTRLKGSIFHWFQSLFRIRMNKHIVFTIL